MTLFGSKSGQLGLRQKTEISTSNILTIFQLKNEEIIFWVFENRGLAHGPILELEAHGPMCEYPFSSKMTQNRG